MPQSFRRKRNRLPLEVYKGAAAYSITTAVNGRRPVFTRPDVVARCLEKLREAAARTNFEVLAYCFMPDHLHLLARAIGETDLVAFMRLLKQLSGYDYRRLTGDSQVLWQTSYYDHVLRPEEDMHAAAQYIWGNPVRAGLADSPREYPHSGSLATDDQWEVEGLRQRRIRLRRRSPTLRGERVCGGRL